MRKRRSVTQVKKSKIKKAVHRPILKGFVERTAKVNGVRLAYSVGGKGSAVVLLHGYARTGYMWRPVMGPLAKRHTVIAPDLRGSGGSEKPKSGYDKKSLAKDVHALVMSLGHERATVVGHDVGMMVAYAYAAQFPSHRSGGVNGYFPTRDWKLERTVAATYFAAKPSP